MKYKHIVIADTLIDMECAVLHSLQESAGHILKKPDRIRKCRA